MALGGVDKQIGERRGEQGWKRKGRNDFRLVFRLSHLRTSGVCYIYLTSNLASDLLPGHSLEPVTAITWWQSLGIQLKLTNTPLARCSLWLQQKYRAIANVALLAIESIIALEEASGNKEHSAGRGRMVMTFLTDICRPGLERSIWSPSCVLGADHNSEASRVSLPESVFRMPSFLPLVVDIQVIRITSLVSDTRDDG